MKAGKLLAIFICLMLFVFAGCGSEEAESGIVPDEPEILTHIFRGERIPLPDEYSLVRGAVPDYDSETGMLTFLCTADAPVYDEAGQQTDTAYEYHAVTMDASFAVTEDIILPVSSALNGNIPTEARFSGDELVYLWSDYDIESGEKPIFLGKYKMQTGENIVSDDITPLFASADAGTRYFVVAGMETDRNGHIYVAADEELMIFDENLIRLTQYTSSSWINSLTVSPDGDVYVSGTFANGSGLYPIDADSFGMGTKISAANAKTMESCYFGEGYSVYYVKDNVLWGYTAGSYEMIMSYDNSNLSGLDILRVLDSETVLAIESSDSGYVPVLYRKAPDVDLSEVKIIELAAADGLNSMAVPLIVEYNKDHPEVRIVVTDYSEKGGADKLAADILTGVYKPDIVAGAPDSSLMETIREHGLYADLYPYIDSDDRVNRDNLFGSVLRTFDDGGKLWGIANAFSVRTMIAQNSVTGERTRWTAEEMIGFADSLDDDVYFVFDLIRARNTGYGETLPSELFGPAGYGIFVDEEAGTASFDSPVFAQYLAYIAGLPEKIDPSTWLYTGDASSFNQAEGRCAVDLVEIHSAADWLWLQIPFNTKDFTVIGYPVKDGNAYGSYLNCESAFVMMADAEYPGETWEAIKLLFPDSTDSFGMFYSFSRGFPALKSVFSQIIANDLTYEYRFWFNGTQSYSRGWYDPENPAKPEDFDEPTLITYFTEEDAAALEDFLDNQVGSSLSDMVSEEITAIVNEEISAYLGGISTAEDCAKVIQSRVEIWLAEHE